MSEKQFPNNPDDVVSFLRERAEGHAPGHDIAIYVRPHQLVALADRLELAEEAVREVRRRLWSGHNP